jgi:dephospho-CoA kinase
LSKIALTGKMRSGKDTVADHLIKNYGFTRFAFGDGIRSVCKDLFPEQFDNGQKPRSLLQGVGQAMRVFNPIVWIRKCFRDIDEYGGANIVITDLRQPNELHAVKLRGYYVIRVSSPDELRMQRMNAAGDNFTMDNLNHETERHIDSMDVDFEIHNDGDLKQLHSQIESILKQIIK